MGGMTYVHVHVGILSKMLHILCMCLHNIYVYIVHFVWITSHNTRPSTLMVYCHESHGQSHSLTADFALNNRFIATFNWWYFHCYIPNTACGATPAMHNVVHINVHVATLLVHCAH